MELYTTDEREKKLDIRQLIYYILDNIKWVIIVGLLCGIVFGAYGYVNSVRLDSEDAIKPNIESIIKKNRDKWNALDPSVMGDAFSDPIPGTYIANTKIYVDFNYGNIEGNSNLDFSAMNNKLQGDIVALALCNESKQAVIDKLNLHSYEDMENISLDDLRYMISCGFLGANILQIQVVDTDSARAQNIANCIANYLVENIAGYETVDDIRVFEDASITISPYKMLGTGAYINNAIKYGILGLFVGIVLVCGIYFALFLFIEKVRTKEDIEYIGLSIFGMIPKKESKKDIEIKRLAYNVSFLEKRNVVMVPTDDVTVIDGMEEGLLPAIKKSQHNLIMTKNLLDNPEVIQNINNDDAAIIVSTYGKTRMNNLEFVKQELERAGVEIVGVLLTEVKH